ncbi:MAG TPA: DoxX family protein [Candidatus Elarobacter sp.]|jgi:putative oxidoreductase|nr:DoxX family protein [Candidatus Elarobacter sp.]
MIADLGLLAARLALGLGVASHGAQKAFGWFEGPGPQGAAGFMDSLGLKPGDKFATAASYNEIGSGLLIALGLGGPIGPAALISNMIVAAETVHVKNGFFAANGGYEVPFLYGTGALALASSGYGALSFDHLVGLDRKLHNNFFIALALAGGVGAAYLVLAQRDSSPPDGTMATPTIKGEHNGQPSSSQPSPATT